MTLGPGGLAAGAARPPRRLHGVAILLFVSFHVIFHLNLWFAPLYRCSRRWTGGLATRRPCSRRCAITPTAAWRRHVIFDFVLCHFASESVCYATQQVQQVLDMWPRDQAALQQTQSDQPDGSVISCIDGAAAALSTPTALQLADRWQVWLCSIVDS